MPVFHSSHEDTSTTLVRRALATQAVDLAVLVNLTHKQILTEGEGNLKQLKMSSKNTYLVILKDSELDFLLLVLDLLRGGVVLLLALLGTSQQSQGEVKGRFFLYIVISKGLSILKLLTSEDQPLLVDGNAWK